MTRVLYPVWTADGVQKLKVAPQRKSLLYSKNFEIIDESLVAPKKPAHGMTPPVLDSSVHFTRCLAQLRSKDKSIEKYIYLSQLKQTDEDMFYQICLTNMSVSTSSHSL